MQIEQLLAFWLVSAVLLLLDVSPAGTRARRDLEILRQRPRHGTRGTLSVLSVAMLMLTHPRHADQALTALCRILARWARSRSVYRLPVYSFRRALSPPRN
jgi:hypothetical protein